MPRVVVLIAALSVLLPASAQAQRCQAPQGTSAVDQYCEVVPGARGDRDADDGGGGSVPDRDAAALVGEGEDGQALARALGKDPEQLRGAGGDGSDGPQGGPGSGSRQATTQADVPASNPFAAVTRAVGGGSTLDSPFFLALFGVIVLVLGAAWVGYRRSAAE